MGRYIDSHHSSHQGSRQVHTSATQIHRISVRGLTQWHKNYVNICEEAVDIRPASVEVVCVLCEWVAMWCVGRLRDLNRGIYYMIRQKLLCLEKGLAMWCVGRLIYLNRGIFYIIRQVVVSCVSGLQCDVWVRRQKNSVVKSGDLNYGTRPATDGVI